MSFYRSTNQSTNKYDHFIKTIEQLPVHLNCLKPRLLLTTADFNAKSSSWLSCNVDIIEGTRLESVISSH